MDNMGELNLKHSQFVLFTYSFVVVVVFAWVGRVLLILEMHSRSILVCSVYYTLRPDAGNQGSVSLQINDHFEAFPHQR